LFARGQGTGLRAFSSSSFLCGGNCQGQTVFRKRIGNPDLFWHITGSFCRHASGDATNPFSVLEKKWLVDFFLLIFFHFFMDRATAHRAS
jgi:hypothetical protein